MCDTTCTNPEHKHHKEELIIINISKAKIYKKMTIEDKKPIKKELQLSKTLEWIAKFGKVHSKRYLYDRFVWSGANEKSWIGCKIHGYFEKTPHKHLRGEGCQKCSKEDQNKKQTKTLEQFIKEANIKHDNFYLYHKFLYKGNKIKGIIICPIHGQFEQCPGNHLQGDGCPICGNKKISDSKKKSLEQFIIEAKLVHGDKYNYSLVKYNFLQDKIIIICNKHGKFIQSAASHLRGSGCPKCGTNYSKGEEKIENWLIKNRNRYTHQKRFDECYTNGIKRKRRYKLPFDFYLPEFNLLIEYDGQQHYIPYRRFGGKEALKKTKRYDKIKTKYCKKNGINLLRIPYWHFDNIDKILDNAINKINY